MKLSNQKLPQRKNNNIYLVLLAFSFFIFIFVNRQSFFQKFDLQIVNKYLRSQDILDSANIIKDRIFVSDSDIYIASGYLYASGANPITYNFQHPPFTKYLFGLSSRYFGMPLLPNIIFAGLLIFEIYLLGKLIFKNELVGFLASLLLLVDPVFREVTTYALLDIGQMVFVLGFIITSFYYKKHFIGQGILLGLAFASKFYSPVVIFLGVIYLYKLITKQFDIKKELLVLLFAFLTFSLCYIKSFPFNIFFEQAKIIKFMLQHNGALEWGGTLKIFFGGYIIWPILFFVNLYMLLKTEIKNILFLIYLLPIFYFLVMCFQIPFTRYFILILPFLYISFANFLKITFFKTT